MVGSTADCGQDASEDRWRLLRGILSTCVDYGGAALQTSRRRDLFSRVLDMLFTQVLFDFEDTVDTLGWE